MAKKRRKEIGFLETKDFRIPSAKGFGEDVRGWDTGGRG
jgi:hypothetical protein